MKTKTRTQTYILLTLLLTIMLVGQGLPNNNKKYVLKSTVSFDSVKTVKKGGLIAVLALDSLSSLKEKFEVNESQKIDMMEVEIRLRRAIGYHKIKTLLPLPGIKTSVQVVFLSGKSIVLTPLTKNYYKAQLINAGSNEFENTQVKLKFGLYKEVRDSS
jgi:hypothetical protein